MSTAARLSPNELDERSEALNASELDRYRDAEWAMHDAEVQSRFPGQWVVAYERKVIAHGADPKSVLSAACRVASDPNHRLVFCTSDSAAWLDHPTDLSTDFAHA